MTAACPRAPDVVCERDVPEACASCPVPDPVREGQRAQNDREFLSARKARQGGQGCHTGNGCNEWTASDIAGAAASAAIAEVRSAVADAGVLAAIERAIAFADRLCLNDADRAELSTIVEMASGMILPERRAVPPSTVSFADQQRGREAAAAILRSEGWIDPVVRPHFCPHCGYESPNAAAPCPRCNQFPRVE